MGDIRERPPEALEKRLKHKSNLAELLDRPARIAFGKKLKNGEPARHSLSVCAQPSCSPSEVIRTVWREVCPVGSYCEVVDGEVVDGEVV
ncbi:MAG: hypothetical protein M3O70_15090, partial [Actinomycetota bacterium]|nr:hypothetical protein [Actinomycetota bacterium]